MSVSVGCPEGCPQRACLEGVRAVSSHTFGRIAVVFHPPSGPGGRRAFEGTLDLLLYPWTKRPASTSTMVPMSKNEEGIVSDPLDFGRAGVSFVLSCYICFQE